MSGEVYYFTFGMGQSMEGYCQPIIANDAKQAREKMFEVYGNEWAMQYTQSDYQDLIAQGYATERLLEPLYAKEKKPLTAISD